VGTGIAVIASATFFAALQQRTATAVVPRGDRSALSAAAPSAASGNVPIDSVPSTLPPLVAEPEAVVGRPADSGSVAEVPIPATPLAAEGVPVARAPDDASQVPVDSLVELGRRVYVEQRCSACHSIAGEGSPRSPLDGVGARLTAEQIRLWVVDPRAARPGVRKPDFADLPPREIDALVAFMQSLR
jgi:mono/diheme cytochrome c family protein